MLNFLPKINRYCTTFETLAEIERDCNERQLYMGDFGRSLRRRLLQLLQSPTQFPPLISRIDILQRTTTLHMRFRQSPMQWPPLTIISNRIDFWERVQGTTILHGRLRLRLAISYAVTSLNQSPKQRPPLTSRINFTCRVVVLRSLSQSMLRCEKRITKTQESWTNKWCHNALCIEIIMI